MTNTKSFTKNLKLALAFSTIFTVQAQAHSFDGVQDFVSRHKTVIAIGVVAVASSALTAFYCAPESTKDAAFTVAREAFESAKPHLSDVFSPVLPILEQGKDWFLGLGTPTKTMMKDFISKQLGNLTQQAATLARSTLMEVAKNPKAALSFLSNLAQ